MASKIPAILDELETRIQSIPGIVSVYRLLDGRPLQTETDDDLPSAVIRMLSDTLESNIGKNTRIALNVFIEIFIVADTVHVDEQLANWLYKMRVALNLSEAKPFNGLLRVDTAIELQAASYVYPDQPGDYAMVRQPLVLRLVENY